MGPKRKRKSGAQNRQQRRAKEEEEKELSQRMKKYFLTAKSSPASNDIPVPGTSCSTNVDSSDSGSAQTMMSAASSYPSSPISESPVVLSDQTVGSHCETESTIGNKKVGPEVPLDTDSDSDESLSDADNCDTDGLAEYPATDRIFKAAEVVGKVTSSDEKHALLEKVACQPVKEVLSERKKKIGQRDRCCSEQVFRRHDGSKRSWLTYCLEKDALFCIPCLLFSDAVLRGEHQRRNQGNAFVQAGFSNWKKQYESVQTHEASQSHIDAKLAQVMFVQRKSLEDVLDLQSRTQEERRKRHVEANRNVMKRVIDTVILLGEQELAFRGHRESLAADPSVNVGNFLETLKFLAKYDEVIASHLEKVENDHQVWEEKKAGTNKGDSSRRFGRGSKLTFLSGDIQNKVIDIISKEIVSEIATLIKDCMAWALIADTTPDVAKREQLSVCVRIVDKDGEVSEHLLFCTKVQSTTADELLNNIVGELENLTLPLSSLVSQTYDGASNMSGKYNGLQAKLKEVAGEHVIFVHCYAHTLNLVLGDAACVSVDVAELFENLQSLYVMVSKSHPINQIFEEHQQDAGLFVRSLKRIDTVRWSAREFSLDMFLERYDAVMHTLESVIAGKKFDSEKRSLADGMRKTFSSKQFLASAFLFREIFAITGPLSRTLQSVNIDFGKALDLLDTALKQLYELRDDPQRILDGLENDFSEIEWEERRVARKKRMPGELAFDEPAASAQEKWRRDVFYIALDSVISGIHERFAQSRHVLEAFSVFSPRVFPNFQERFPTTVHVEQNIREFCNTYGIDSHQCAKELFSFSSAFKMFIFDNNSAVELDSEDVSLSAAESDDGFCDPSHEATVTPEDRASAKVRTFIDCLAILTNAKFQLIDAYPTLVRVYAIAVAIPITSCSAERSFSTLKRVKTRLRSTMGQERLEGLLRMSIERKILRGLDRDRLIDLLGKSSKELGMALLP